MTLTVIGHGYVGLVSACVFADFGNKVWVIGHTKEKLDRLRSGDPIIYEPGLQEMLQKNLEAGRLHFTDSYEEAIKESSIVFITVGTPPKPNGDADLSAVFTVTKQIAKHLGPHFTVVSCKSTVPVGTNRKVETILNKFKPKTSSIAIASCPEFLREGTALQDTLQPDRVVIGSDDERATERMLELHSPIPGNRVITDLASAELIKYASNSMLATKISFANLIALYCEKTGADVEKVLDAVGMDRRIGRSFMYAGVGYGGSCFPKDVQALISTGTKYKVNARLLKEVENINQKAKENYLEHVLKGVKGKKIGILGLSFKPDTDDIRFAPSVFIIRELLKHGFEIQAYDAVATEHVRKIFGSQVNFVTDPYDAIKGADALCLLTEWNEFKQMDLHRVKSLMKTPQIFDGRNIYDPVKVREMGFVYYGIGRN